MQQYFTVRRDLNEPLNAMIGQSFNEKSKHESLKILNEIHSVAQQRTIDKKALCYIVKNGDEIKGVGGSTVMERSDGKLVSNLILNQFGRWLSRIHKGGVITISVPLFDNTNTIRTFNIYTGSTQFNDSNGARMRLQVGSGTTAPVRTDFDIETALSTAPESAEFESSIPVYNVGNANFKNDGGVTAGGTGTVNEAIMQALWIDNTVVGRLVTLYRDIISPGQVFSIGETIALEYTTQI